MVALFVSPCPPECYFQSETNLIGVEHAVIIRLVLPWFVAPDPSVIRHAFRNVDIIVFCTGIAFPVIFPVLLYIFQTLYLLTHPALLFSFSQLRFTELFMRKLSMAARTYSVSCRKIQCSFIRDDVKGEVRIRFIFIERSFCLASIQVNILIGCHSKTGLLSTVDILHLVVQSEHGHCIHNAVLDEFIRQWSLRPQFIVLL